MIENNIIYASGNDPEMIKAFEKAQQTFKYFWRELNWEFRRIVPALDLACVKIAFMQEVSREEPIVEYMWINDIGFDGDTVTGTLINDPDLLTNVKNGDFIDVPLGQVSDWLFASNGKTYGGFTIQLMRSRMLPEELKEHDEAWGLDFGDYNDIEVVSGQKGHPENLVEHPMSVNMKDKLIDFLKQYPQEISHKDESGYTLLHRETVAGNRTSVEVLLQSGADVHTRTHSGKTALDFARQLEWEHLIPLLENN
ncbi:DUF2314 domain-containing protein [Cytophagaceae bacterium DM2B3-1]|uniref:DUF2314 domain-containing protein n=1 Tax=Xanthocytophaga flava TaxID=3048013 RepID=A0ABT7CW04_9BACT|nr:DUF2314 domain-containing protein [Xanthocytophaga flavus]MDJ1497954.1 DUF2314 domain-containing protein [Xanthocytophaga flavus]